MKTRIITAAIAAAAVASTLLMSGPAQADESAGTVTCQTPPEGTNATATAEELTTKFFQLMKEKNMDGLETFIHPAFQAGSGNGTGRNAETFLSTPLPNVTAFKLSRMKGRLHDSLLTARYLLAAKGDIAGAPYAIKAAPRLSVFTYCSGEWQMVAHANFDPLRK